ncbi:hypothetical protein BC828DRAFT_389268 [Blastocladiella britannica]|nr:hypothetical protein BC828DRAFT_389268 [Blastocladiella britannica]
MTTPKIDGKPSVLVRCSAGGETDPRMFYATTYRTYFHQRNTMINKPDERTLNKQFRWDETDPVMIRRHVQAAGYQRNLLPHFEYDKGVDEGDHFRDDEHFVTSNSSTYKNPATVPPSKTGRALSASAAGTTISHIPDLSKYMPLESAADIKVDGKWNVFESTMKSSYKMNDMFPHLKKIGHTRITGADHESAWVRDRPHEIAGIKEVPTGTDGPRFDGEPLDVMQAKKAFRVSSLGETGYNRSDAVLPESDTTKPYPTPHFALDHLSKSSPLDREWMSMHPDNDYDEPCVESNGAKQDTAATRDVPVPDLFSAMQFRTWETSYSASYDPRATISMPSPVSSLSPARAAAAAAAGTEEQERLALRINRGVDHSGYTMSNKYEFEPYVKGGERPAVSDGVRQAEMDAMQWRARALQQEGLVARQLA